MKLSEVKGERAFDILPEIMDAVAPIANDPEAAALFRVEKKPDGMSSTEYGAQWIKRAAVALIKPHKKECIKVNALIHGVGEKEYAQTVTLEGLLDDVADWFSDAYFRDLFFSSSPAVREGSGSGSETTGDRGT